MALHCYYQKFSALIILLTMINVDFIQSGLVPNECSNYCSNGGYCHISNTGPKCICLPNWTGVRCHIPSNATFIEQAGATQADTDERNNECTKLPADFCLHNGICYIDIVNNKYACYCRFPYTGDHCEEVSECYDYCLNNGLCDMDVTTNEPKCTCTPEWTGIRCGKLVTTTTAATTPTTTTPSVLCLRLGPNYCNSGICILVAGSPQCLCPPTFTGAQCNIPVTVTGPGSITPTVTPIITTTTQGRRCELSPCKNGRCYPTGNSYHCVCTPQYTGKDCDTPI